MARDRPKWKQKFDFKPEIRNAFSFVEKRIPFITDALRYHSLVDVPSKVEEFEHLLRPLALYSDKYSKSRVSLSINNCDKLEGGDAKELAQIRSALISDPILFGHIPAIFSATSRRLKDYTTPILKWGEAYPRLSWKSARKISGIIVLTSNNRAYYHDIIEYLIPAVSSILRNSNLFIAKPITFLTRAHHPALEFLVKILQQRGFNAKIEMFDKSDTIRADAALVSKAVTQNKSQLYAFREEMDLIGEQIDRQIDHIKTLPSRVYIPRVRTKKRNILNQDELIDGLNKRSIATMVLHSGNFLEQVALFRRAELVISPHGASLSNLIWGTNKQVIEFFAEDVRLTHYLNIAAEHDWTYTPLFGSSEFKRQDFNAPIEDILDHVDTLV